MTASQRTDGTASPRARPADRPWPEPPLVRSLAVYHFEGCPYCQLVRIATRRLALPIEWRDIDLDPAHFRALARARGQTTVPVLRVEREGRPTVWLPESEDIIGALRALDRGEPAPLVEDLELSPPVARRAPQVLRGILMLLALLCVASACWSLR